ncbi:MAG: sigma-70 family RNA polymerase sigma factor [Bryobacteraceae bacterium]|nr:sigma-70 family RNA polymerase sigma factor [Bryobacteraceae bacterium]
MADTEFTGLLSGWRAGDPAALDRLTPLVFDELHRLAIHYMAGERRGHTLQPTALVNEAFLKLSGDRAIDWESRSHFVAIAANHMRRILVDYARKKKAEKRGGDAAPVTLKDDHAVTGGAMAEILTLDEALDRLGKVDERKLRAVEMRFFGGMEMQEIALVLGVHAKTIQNDLRMATAWLRSELSGARA